MRIVHIITRLILGGAQENTLLTCREQSRLGHGVTLLTGPPLGQEGSLLDVAQALPIRTVLVPALRRAIHPWHDAVAYHDLVKNLREIRPDVVHTHSSKAGILGRRAARAAAVACIVHTIHGLPFDAWQGRLANWAYRWTERRAARRSHRLIAVCADMADRAAATGLAPRSAIRVVYSAIDPEPFRAAEGEREAVRLRWGAGPQTFVFLKVARLFDLKGHEYVLPAFARVAAQFPQTMLVLAGEGVLRGALEAEAVRLGIAQRLRFLGLVPPERVPGILWGADAVVHAGLREGLARVLPQAGLSRRPVVAYDIGGAREVVRDGQNGSLLPAPPPGQAAAEAAAPVAEAMARLVADPLAARRMGERWVPEVLNRFDCRQATGEIMQVYREVLGG
jgi:glycosyltransferase involved in cell wall biosynthesis